MKHELELKVQAWLDGEASDRDAARLADWIARDAEAGAVAAELGTVKKTMAGSELTPPVPDSREFYWSKIERQIQREASAPRQEPISWAERWRRLLMPLAGATAFIFVLTFAIRQVQQPAFDEISSTDTGMDAVTFHDQSAEMTVVWLQDNSQPSGAAQHTADNATSDEANSDTDTE
jgi:hypothetical protein